MPFRFKQLSDWAIVAMRPVFLIILAQAGALVWPPPLQMSAEGPPLALAPYFGMRTHMSGPGVGLGSAVASKRLAEGAARYEAAVSAVAPVALRSSAGTPAVEALDVFVASADTKLNLDTRYDYELSIAANGTAIASATSIYGAMYAMETFVQLIDMSDGRLSHSTVSVRDGPAYKWRGLMIDAGRRFFPMETVRNLLDTMAANKLNVLHLHASDMCRFGVESKLFPNLTASLTGIRAGHYTQQDIRDMISYGSARGIRIVPEFDVPGHSRGFIPLESEGVKFCKDVDSRSQIYGDPENRTFGVLKMLFKEMAGLFEDEVFNIGCDETTATGSCSVNSTVDLERKIFNYLSKDLGKTPAAWEEALVSAHSATQDTIVDSWTGAHAGEITKSGRRAIESAAGHFYFTSAARGGPEGWKKCWYGIGSTVPASQRELLLGGEMSMWTDTYCYINQCGAFGGGAPVGHDLFDPKYDKEWGRSVAGMIWPRGYVAAASFWNYNETEDPSSDAFTASIWRLNDQLIARGSWVCPTNCSCDQLSACGKPYLKKTEIRLV